MASGEFGTKVRTEGSKYVWFGTDHVFDAFTFAFRETEHGLFNAHAYPYDERMSTFIVECPEQVWRAAGLDEMDEDESLAFCEQLFANELRGRELFSNRSLWLDFPKVTNETWHVGNVVILGDAAHTAHFSIGSGTKLAMEDAIALAQGLVRRRWDVPAALVDYELERGPLVERTQEAASESAAYFGRIASYSHLEPIQFAFNLITRTGRITHATLGVRDPQFTRALDSWLGGRAVSPPPAFSPFELRGVRFENRFELVESTAAVSEEGRTTPDDRRSRAGTARGQGPAPPGSCRTPRRDSAAEPTASTCRSPTAGRWWRPRRSLRPVRRDARRAGRGCRSSTQFVARRARSRARVDVLELDMAHGYLLGSYLSPLTNDGGGPPALPAPRARGGARGLGRAARGAALRDRLAPARQPGRGRDRDRTRARASTAAT